VYYRSALADVIKVIALRSPRAVSAAEAAGECRSCHRRLAQARKQPQARVAADTGNVHTPTMTLKTAALLALFGTILMTVLLVWNFIFNVANALRGLVPAVTLFQSFIYAFGCFTVAVFFYVFHRAQES